MNQYEKRMIDLRMQAKAERRTIQKESNRRIGHLNNAIGQVTSPEARAILRDAKGREYYMTRNSMRYNRECYLQQLELIKEEYALYLEQNPSNRHLRRMMCMLKKAAEKAGVSSMTFWVGENQIGTVSFETVG